jgi:hypothetical protein
VCVVRALRVGPGYISVDWEKCTGCGKCVAVCDRGALTLRGAESALAVVSNVVPIRADEPAPKKWGRHSASPAPASATKPQSRAPQDLAGAGPVAWTLAEGGLVLLVAFALLLAAQALPGGFAGAPVWAGVTLVVYDAALAALLWFLARRRGVGLLAAFRLDVAPELSSIAFAFAVALGCWAFSITYGAIARGLGATPPVLGGVGLTSVFGSGALSAALTFAVVAVVGPLLEEVLLRGVVLGAMARRVGAWPAIVASALAFALLHASLWSLLPLTVLGVGLGWLATRSRSLWPAVIAHVLYNAVLVTAAFYALH